MGMRKSMPRNSRFRSTAGVRSLIPSEYESRRWSGTRALGSRDGLVRDVCRNVPPVRPARLTASSVSSTTCAPLSASGSGIRSTSPAQPRRMPSTRYPSRRARTVTARIAGLSPGTSPPPVRMPMVPLTVVICTPAVAVSHSWRYRATPPARRSTGSCRRIATARRRALARQSPVTRSARGPRACLSRSDCAGRSASRPRRGPPGPC